MFKRTVLISAAIVLLLILALPMSLIPHQVLAAGPTATPAPTIARTIELDKEATAFYQDGHYQEAIDAWEQAVAIMKQLGYLQNQGVLLSNIGAAYESLGELQRSLNYYNQALAIAQQVGNRLGTAQTLANIGNTHADQGRYSQALDEFNKSLTIMRQLGDQQAQAIILGSIGNVYQSQGQYSTALTTYQQALALSHAVRDQQNVGFNLEGIGDVYQRMGKYDQALDFFNQALTIAQQVDDPAGQSRILGNMGTLYGVQGQYDRALTTLNKALAAKRTLGDQLGEAETLTVVGGAYVEQGQYDDALVVLNQALKIEQAIGSLGDEGTTLDNIGVAYKGQNNFPAAVDFYTQSLTIRRQNKDRIGEGEVLTNLGNLYYDQQHYDLAVDTLKQAIAVDQEVNLSDSVSALGDLGVAYEALGQTSDAIDSYQQSATNFETLLDNAVLESTVTSLLKVRSNLLPFHRLAYLLAQTGDVAGAINITERGHAVLARAEMVGKVLSISDKTDQTLLDEDTRLRADLDSAQQTLAALQKDISASAEDIQAAQAAVEAARQDYQTHLEAMQVQNGLFTQQFTSKVSSLSDIQAALPADTTLVLYSVDQVNSVAFVINSTSADAVMLNSPRADLANAVDTLNADRRANSAMLSTLYKLAVEPIIPKIKTSHLIIAPDDLLAYVPFAALQDANGHFLIDSYSISMIPSGTMLALLSQRKPQGTAITPGLVLAQADAPGLPHLEFARSEADDVAKLLGVKAILSASADDLVKKSAGSRVIHISAHAELDIQQPLFSAIYLKTSNGDNRFEVQQIYDLNLSKGTELVVLSGCDTAAGGTGEDFGVLTRAFFTAGTPRVVASLWSVDDESTAFLMSAYFAARSKGGREDEALRTAMLATRDKFPEPYYWASFVLSGLS